MLPGPFAGTTVLTVYFDADCGLCQDVARILRRLDWLGRLHLVPLQAPAARQIATADELLTTLHARDGWGDVSTGAAACIEIARRVPLLWTLSLVARLRVLRPLLERAYALVARHRHRIGRTLGAAACSVDPRR